MCCVLFLNSIRLFWRLYSIFLLLFGFAFAFSHASMFCVKWLVAKCQQQQQQHQPNKTKNTLKRINSLLIYYDLHTNRHTHTYEMMNVRHSTHEIVISFHFISHANKFDFQILENEGAIHQFDTVVSTPISSDSVVFQL